MTHHVYKQDENSISPELCLILHLTADLYRRPAIRKPKKVIWNKLVELAADNKVLYYVLSKIAEKNEIGIANEVLCRLERVIENERNQLLKFRRTLQILPEIFGEEYLVFNTCKFYPYASHDIDVHVRTFEKAERALMRAGFKPAEERLVKFGLEYGKNGFLNIDVSEKFGWGSITVLDEEIAWANSRRIYVDGVEVRLPSIEGDLLYIIAHTNFQLYRIELGDLLYLYRHARKADWYVMTQQAKKHNWYKAYCNFLSIVNTFHKIIYAESCPIEEHIPIFAQRGLNLPYVYSLSEVVRALMEKGFFNFIKLPSYLGIRLMETSKVLHKIYCSIVLDRISKYFIKYVYY